MRKVMTIEVEPLVPDMFEPFGEIVGPKITPPVFAVPNVDSWRMRFRLDGKTDLMFIRFYYQPLCFFVMERHFHVTQSFLPLGKTPTVVAVSAPTNLDDLSAVPEPQTMRAFYLDGTMGIMLWKGTWHGLQLPISPPHADFGLINETETQKEFEVQLRDGTPLTRTQKIDFKELFNVEFKIVDSQGIIARS